MKNIEYHYYRFMAVIHDIDLEKKWKGLKHGNTRPSNSFESVKRSTGEAAITLCKGGTKKNSLNGNYAISNFNLFNAIINEMQKNKCIGKEYHEPINLDAWFSELIEDQKEYHAEGKSSIFFYGIKALWNSNLYPKQDVSQKKMLAVVYDVPRCEVKCYEYNAGKIAEFFSGNAEQFNESAKKDLDGYKVCCQNDKELCDAFLRLWEENKIKLANERKEKDGVVLMDETEKEQWIKQIEADAKPKNDFEIMEARARYRHDDKQKDKQKEAV